jgi:hypothetical protein
LQRQLALARVVLTAGHCLVHDGVTRWPYAAFIGADARRGGTFLRVQGGAVHASTTRFSTPPIWRCCAWRMTSRRWWPLEVAGTSPAPGDEVHFAGFGESDDGPAHYQHAGRAAVTSVAADYFRYTPGTAAATRVDRCSRLWPAKKGRLASSR